MERKLPVHDSHYKQLKFKCMWQEAFFPRILEQFHFIENVRSIYFYFIESVQLHNYVVPEFKSHIVTCRLSVVFPFRQRPA